MYLGTEAEPQNPRRPSPQALFLRTVSYSNQITLEYAEKLLLSGLDELDRAMLDPRVLNTASSRMFLNLPTPLDLGTADTMEYFSEIMDSLLSRHASRCSSVPCECPALYRLAIDTEGFSRKGWVAHNRTIGRVLLNRHQVGGVSRSPDGLFAQQEREPMRGRPALRGKRTYGGPPGQRGEDRAPGPHAHRNTARQATDGLWTEARRQQK